LKFYGYPGIPAILSLSGAELILSIRTKKREQANKKARFDYFGLFAVMYQTSVVKCNSKVYKLLKMIFNAVYNKI
jgi:hypothetical protein